MSVASTGTQSTVLSQMYALFARAIRGREPRLPDFATAVDLHRLVDAIKQSSDTGREVFLYRVNAGESCVLTTACMLADEDYSAEAITETDVEAVAIPRAAFDDFTGRSPIFRRFIFQTYSRRIADLFGLIDDIIFQRIDVRLAERLLELDQGGHIATTHQALAVELGTAREVISRTLGEFQRRGWVELARGEIRIGTRAGLEKLARSVT